MSEIQEGPRKASRTNTILVVVGVAVVLAALYGAMAIFFKPKSEMSELATGHMSKLVFADRPDTASKIAFVDASGKALNAADFKGSVVVLNLWATWCGPCKVEMPTLAKLQSDYAGKPVKVVTVSTDRDDAMAEAKAFIATHPPLAFYGGGEKLPFLIEPHVLGFPTTILFDAKGHERARMAGDADWSSPEAHKVVDALIAEGG
jgi:thiol-disulfide isomerase/thioredoxin